MGCIPETGGCERIRTEPFVSFLNESRNTNYRFKACLDQIYRTEPQPEALYYDIQTDGALVIERKTVAWPEGCVEYHKNDHLISEIVSDGLNQTLSDDYYRLDLVPFFNGKRQYLEKFTKDIVANVLFNIEGLRTGKTITDPQQASPESARRRRWQIRKLASWEIEPNDQVGVQIFWDARPSRELIPSSLPAKLLHAIERLFLSCERKFNGYQEAVKILIFEPHGDLRYQRKNWWEEVWKAISPPDSIDEIWMGIMDYLDEVEEGWIFEKLFQNRCSSRGDHP